MTDRILSAAALILTLAGSAVAQEASPPIELDVLEAYVGVWDAEIEVWPAGPDSSSIKFKGVETNQPYGKHWIASNFDSEYEGQTVRVHSIIGYDLGKKKMVGTVIDDGPYAASMTGEYDKESKTVHWITNAKDASGNPLTQKTLVKQTSGNQRVLELMVPGEKSGEFKKFMQITFTKRD